MTINQIEGHGAVIDGQSFTSPDEAIDAATIFYQDKGKDGFELAKEVTIAKNTAAASFAWYCDEHGFVQQDHVPAKPVTVVAMFVNESIA